jgi:hypothetical protein
MVSQVGGRNREGVFLFSGGLKLTLIYEKGRTW